MTIISVKIKFLGGTMEVGRSAIAIKTQEALILLDYGVMFNHEPGFPAHIPPREVDAIVLSHAHLDHSGAIPMFHIRGHAPVYATQVTFDFARLLISDFIHLTGYYLPYEYIDLQSMLNCCINTEYNKPTEVKDIKVELLNGGHIPGSAQVIVETPDKKILYTSDFNTIDTELLNGANQSYEDIDALIIESTYANEDHTDRRVLEKTFVKKVLDMVESGGTVLVPAFSVGRAQEILCILASHNFEYPVTIDGMAKEANAILMRYPKYLRDNMLFMNAVHTANWVSGWRDRRLAIKKPGVIVSPAGMLKGGPSVFYAQKLAKKKKNAIFLVSYQIPGTPGRELLEKGRFVLNGKTQNVKAHVEHFDFSSHCGRRELHRTIQKMRSETKIFVVHGAEENPKILAEWAQTEAGLKAVAPEAGDVFKL